MLKDTLHRLRLWLLGRKRSPEYRAYLKEQMVRSLSKRSADTAARSRRMAVLAARFVSDPSACRVLCIGPRGPAELAGFREAGFGEVVGIDLFSADPDIRVMDMHHMTFDDDTFDLVNTCHSLEHSYDVARAISEIVRVAQPGAIVAIEVPVRFGAGGADRVDFGSADAVLAAFGDAVKEVLLKEELPPKSPTNDTGTDVARVVLALAKGREHG